MSEFIDVILKHPRVIFEIFLGYWIFSAAVSGMPLPKEDQFWYNWLYTSAHTLAGSLKTAVNDPRLQAVLPKGLAAPKDQQKP